MLEGKHYRASNSRLCGIEIEGAVKRRYAMVEKKGAQTIRKIMVGFVGGLFVVALFASPGCKSKTEKQEPLRIAALYPLTGHLALLGEESWRGAEIARLMRNEKGGVAGRNVEYVKVDVPDVNAAKSEAERLVSRGDLKLFIGTYSSSLCLAASEVVARAGIPYFELGAIADAITGRGYKTVFRTCPKAQLFSRSQVLFIKEWLAPELGKDAKEIRVSLAHEDSSYGSSVARNLDTEAGAAGLQIVSVVPYSSQSVDLSSVILTVKNDHPDAVIAVSYANDAILLGRQAKELGLDIDAFIGTGGGHSLQSFQEALGSATEGVFNVDFTQYEVNQEFTPGLSEFVAVYEKTFGEKPRSGHSLANFMGANVVLDILEKTKGVMDVEQIHTAAMSTEIEAGMTATGWGVKFNQDGQNILATPLVLQWRGGKLLTVWPETFAVMEPALIKPFSQ
jgi:branched-chain amino acid transport system substrate-binding protein